jgi:hypothetical protein
VARALSRSIWMDQGFPVSRPTGSVESHLDARHGFLTTTGWGPCRRPARGRREKAIWVGAVRPGEEVSLLPFVLYATTSVSASTSARRCLIRADESSASSRPGEARDVRSGPGPAGGGCQDQLRLIRRFVELRAKAAIHFLQPGRVERRPDLAFGGPCPNPRRSAGPADRARRSSQAEGGFDLSS